MKTLLFLFVISLNLMSACGQSTTSQDKTSNTNQNTTNLIQSTSLVESQILRTEKFKIKDYEINLVSKSDKCELNYKKGEIEKILIVDVPPPCKTLEWYGWEDSDNLKYKGKLKRFVKDYTKFPKIKAVVIVIVGAATKANVVNVNNKLGCKKGNGFGGFRIILVKDNDIKKGYGSTPETDELYAEGCESGLLARFFDGPFLLFNAEEEYP